MIPRAVSRCGHASSSSAAAKKAVKKGFASSTKPVRAVAAALADPSSSSLPPPFSIPSSPSSSTSPFHSPLVSQLHLLNHRPAPTVLPTPLPRHEWSAENETLYPSSNVQGKLNLIEACLLDLHDVSRAKKVFDAMRQDLVNPLPEAILSAELYNRMLEGYFDLAASGKTMNSSQWSDEAWNLYDEMAEGRVTARLDAESFHIALSNLQKFPEQCLQAGKTPVNVLKDIISHHERPSMKNIITRNGHLDFEGSQPLATFVLGEAEGSKIQSVAKELQTFLVQESLPSLPEVKPVLKAVKTRADGTTTGEASSSASVNDHGLQVPYNIASLRENLQKIIQTRSDTDSTQRQLLMEENVYEAAKKRLEHEASLLERMDLASGLKKHSVQRWMWEWYGKLKDRLEHDVMTLKGAAIKQTDTEVLNDKGRLAPFLCAISTDKLAMITILEVMMQHFTTPTAAGVKTARTLMDVGRAVEQEYQSRLLRKYKVPRTGKSPMSASGLAAIVERRELAMRASKRSGRASAPVLEWTAEMRLKVGGICVDALMDVATIKRQVEVDGQIYAEDHPAFSNGYDHVRGFKIGVIRLNPAIAEELANKQVGNIVHPRQLPMLVQPRPWTSDTDGAYLSSKSSVMRIKECSEQVRYLREAVKDDKLETIFRGLDVLSSTPWVINKSVFDVVLEVWNGGEAIADIPPASISLQEPEKPENYDTDMRVRANHTHAIREALQQHQNNHSQRCSTNYKMEVARAFLDEKFYFPHNLDFRGRAYPIPPHLNHIGDDLSRGLLKFAEAKPLGARGLRWLKIHCANVFGNDKASLDDRAAFTEQHLKDIYDSAEKPLTGARWWLKADDPWQCLATCMELRAALESPDPLKFESNLPVHQDGTCNGLQHYAAIGGDAIGAAQVNLDVTDKPSDVYSFVANMVEEEILKDIAAGKEDVKLISGKISRKVVKQTVMTTVYGVTQVGARAQIERQLIDRGDIPREKVWPLASYIAVKVLGCIGDLFKGANAIQNWLTISARAIARSVPARAVEKIAEMERASAEMKEDDTDPEAAKKRGPKLKLSRLVERTKEIKQQQMTSVIWTSALGLPIVQPYRKVIRKQINTGTQTVYISDPNRNSEVSPQKQATAFPPNFIHSLDATHMLLTALEMSNANMTFASVHDSYWTHASCIDDMSVLIRDTFVKLHSKSLLEDMYGQWLEQYKDHQVPAHALGEEDLQRLLTREDLPADLKIQICNSSSRAGKLNKDTRDALQSLQTDVLDEDGLYVPSAKLSVKPTEDDTTLTPRGLLTFVPLTLLIPPLPERGSFDVAKTRDSPYFFS